MNESREVSMDPASMGGERTVYAHPSALVEAEEIGEGTSIWAFTHVMEGASIGANCNVGDHCFIETGVRVGNNVTIKNGSMLWEGIVLEDGVFVGPGVIFTNDRYPRSRRLSQARERYSSPGWQDGTRVRKGATLGAGAVIMAGITIGEFSMVAAGCVVTRDVPPYATVVGNPGRLAGWSCQCGYPLNPDASTVRCSSCGRRYILHAGEEFYVELTSEDSDAA